jgi:hypothetical protein
MKSLSLTILLIFAVNIANAVVSTKKTPPLYVQKDVIIMVNNKPVTLRSGTPVVAEAAQTYSSKTLSVGQSINVRAKFNVVADKHTLISAGSLGSATVSDLKKGGMFGKAGRMELQVQSIQAVDGQQVLLSGIPLTLEGDSKAGLAWTLSIILFLTTIIGGGIGFFIKGKDAEFRSGMQLNSSVASDIEVEPKS